MKHILKKTACILFITGVLFFLIYVLYVRPKRVVPILMYHSISYNRKSSLNVTPENFSKQIDFLVKDGYSIISFDTLVEMIKEGIIYVPKTVVVTFDDGYEDNYLYAFPVLAKYGLPATIFLISSCIDNSGYMNWDQIRIMSKNGVSFGGHTRNHVYLPSIKDNEDKLWEEIAGCRSDIELRLGERTYFFAFPVGAFNENIKDIVKKAGYKGACTTNRGNERFNRDVYELNRVKVTNSDISKPFHFRTKVSGFYNIFRQYKKRGE